MRSDAKFSVGCAEPNAARYASRIAAFPRAIGAFGTSKTASSAYIAATASAFPALNAVMKRGTAARMYASASFDEVMDVVAHPARRRSGSTSAFLMRAILSLTAVGQRIE